MNDLERFFNNNTHGTLFKWHHYFEIYDRHLSHLRGTEVHILEFGIFQGGSLRMWKDYFGPQCKVYGVDINEHCIKLTEDQVEIFIGDQNDRTFLKSLIDKIPQIDVLIDDGGHRMQEQINTFEVLFDHIDQNGIFICEDLHTSYWGKYGGGYKASNSFIEYSKNLIDKIHAWHSKTDELPISKFTKTAKSLHYYDSILVIEKSTVEKPSSSRTGQDLIPTYKKPKLIHSTTKKNNKLLSLTKSFIKQCLKLFRQNNSN